LSCRLTRCIDIEDKVAPTLPVEDAANGFRDPPRGLALLLEECAEGF